MTDTQADGITIQPELNLPPDGTYPPRILTPTTTIWLCEGTIIDIDDGLSVSNRGGKCYIEQKKKRDHMRLNGIVINGEHLLKDCDFIKLGQWRGMFQLDPVADYRQAISEDYFDREIYRAPIHLSANLAENIMLNSEGISLNGGKDIAVWSDLCKILLYPNIHPITRVIDDYSIYVAQSIHNPYRYGVPTTVKPIHEDEIDQFVAWLLNTVPFLPSTENFPNEADAYFCFAYRKLLVPHQVYKVPLPETREFILGITSHYNDLFWLTALYLMANFIICFTSGLNHLLPIVLVGSTLILALAFGNYYRRNKLTTGHSTTPRFGNRKNKKID